LRDELKSQTLAINEKSKSLEAEGKTVYKLGFGESPFPVPQFLIDEVVKNASANEYLPVQGLEELRKAFCSWIYAKYQAKYEPQNVIVAPGSKMNLFTCIASLSDNVEIIIVTPAWVTYFPITVIQNKKMTLLHTKPENNFIPTPEQVDELCAAEPNKLRVMIFNYPNNPSGTSLTIAQAKSLAASFRKNNIVILSDEIYGELFGHVNNGKDEENSHSTQVGHVSIATYCPERVILSNGISKVVGAGGYRMGVMAIPKDLAYLIKPMSVLASNSYSAVNAPIEKAAISVFKGYTPLANDRKPLPATKDALENEIYLSRSRRILNPIRRYAYDKLKASGVIVAEPTAAFYIYPIFTPYADKLKKRGITNDKDLCLDILAKKSVAVLYGSAFQRPADEFGMRVCLVDFNGKEVLDALAKEDEKNGWVFNNHSEVDVDMKFLEKNCAKLLKGINNLAEYAEELKAEK